MENLSDIPILCYAVFTLSAIVFLLFAIAKRVVISRKHPRPWNQDPDDYDSEHDLF